jgi:hypothetical protein
MIGYRTKWVVAVQNYSKVCLICEMHSNTVRKNETPDIAIWVHNCPWNHEGSSKGMIEAKAALECVNIVWTTSETRAFINIICIRVVSALCGPPLY